jgi:hypothetical protein
MHCEWIRRKERKVRVGDTILCKPLPRSAATGNKQHNNEREGMIVLLVLREGIRHAMKPIAWLQQQGIADAVPIEWSAIKMVKCPSSPAPLMGQAFDELVKKAAKYEVDCVQHCKAMQKDAKVKKELQITMSTPRADSDDQDGQPMRKREKRKPFNIARAEVKKRPKKDL